MTLGKNLILTLDGTAIAASKSCKIAVSQSFIDVCSPTEARVLSKQPTTYDWSMSSDCLVATPAYADAILDMVTNGTRLLVQCYDLTLGLFRSGYAYVQNADITGSVGSLMTLNISLVGSGALNKLRWGDIDKTLEGGLSVYYLAQTEDEFRYGHAGLHGLYIAIKQNNQYVRWDDGRSGDELSNSIDDDNYTREAHFKGGYSEYYIVSGTLDGNVITASMVCKILIPLIAQFNNTWFVVSLSAVCTDYEASMHGDGDELVTVSNIKISRSES